MKNITVKILLFLVIFITFNVSFINANELEEQEVFEEVVQTSSTESNSNDSNKKEEPKNEEVTVEKTDKPVVEEKEPEIEVVNQEIKETNDTEVITVEEETKEKKSFRESVKETETQKVKVIINKVDENGNYLAGAKLQIINSKGKVVDEWISNGKPRIVYLVDDKYTLHEVRAPKGYKRAEDKKFVVKNKLSDLEAGVDYSEEPCPHYGGTPMYYVTIEGVKNEVYCINQGWETPDENSNYNGDTLNPDSIRDYTKQTIPVGVNPEETESGVTYSDGPVDISDQTLSNEELYNKLLDIIYHRSKAASVLRERGLEYSEEEIRYITEVALKNYTNAGIAEHQYRVKATPALLNALDEAGVVYKTYLLGSTTYISYIKHNYRDYVYDPDAPLGQDIFKTVYGQGNSFGQMVAGHWSTAHNAKIDQEQRDKVARYYELFKYLISDEDPHPDEMKLYIYSSNSISPKVSKNNHDGGKYQNLLGVTGYIEEIEEAEPIEITLVNNPQTADNVLIYVLTALFGILGLIGFSYLYLKSE